jgi:hypothetical protein
MEDELRRLMPSMQSTSEWTNSLFTLCLLTGARLYCYSHIEVMRIVCKTVCCYSLQGAVVNSESQSPGSRQAG